MKAHDIWSLLGATVTLAVVTVIVSNGGNSASVINAAGGAWSGILRAGEGH